MDSKVYGKRMIEYINLMRVAKGNLTWRQLADLAGTSVQNIYTKVNNGAMRATDLYMIADIMGCDVKFIDRKTGKVWF